MKIRNCQKQIKEKEKNGTDMERLYNVADIEYPIEQKKVILERAIPELMEIFGNYLVKIITFEHDELNDVNLAVLLDGYSTELYAKDAPKIRAVTEGVNMADNICTLSVITVNYDTVKEHPLYSSIKAGEVVCVNKKQKDV